jgi:drug/metabolite transporter (DMT)-like permease
MPTDLVIVRFWSLSLLGFLYLLWRRARSPVRAVRLSPWNASLWLTSAFQFAIAYTTYVSLQNTLPIYYSIPMTAGGIALTTTKFPKLRWLLAPGLFFAIGVAILITYSPSWPPVNILMTLLAVLFFSGFFVTAARYKEKEHVSARADQFFFLTSLICLIGTLPLLQDSHLLSILPTTFVYMVLFSIFITGLPYYILYYFLKTKDFTLLGNISFVTMLCTALTQWFILGAPNAVSLVSGGFVLAGAFLIILLQTKLRSR